MTNFYSVNIQTGGNKISGWASLQETIHVGYFTVSDCDLLQLTESWHCCVYCGYVCAAFLPLNNRKTNLGEKLAWKNIWLQMFTPTEVLLQEQM